MIDTSSLRLPRFLSGKKHAKWIFLTLFSQMCVTLGAEYSPLFSLPAPAIRESTASYSDDKYKAANLLDENPRTEFAANEQDATVFVEFDFRSPVSLAAFRHVDRNDPARVAASELIFL